MQYTKLGDPELSVSRICLGCMGFGDARNGQHSWTIDEEHSREIIYEIVPETPYTSADLNYNTDCRANREQNDASARPAISGSVDDMDQYDVIFLGYCNWWSSIPAPVRSFLMHDDLSGKTIVPFCSMGGGQFGQTISAICKLAPDNVIKEGLMVTYSSYDRAEISTWLNENNIPTN